MSDINKYSIVFLAVLLFVFVSCSKSDTQKPIDRTPTINSTTDLIIGAEDQPLEHQLGRPIAVRTDEEGTIYIADRASKQIKLFDEEGNHLNNLGGRGRGPGEFQDMEWMELAPGGDLVFMDRGRLHYMVISTNGEEKNTFPYQMSHQFAPRGITYTDDKVVGLFKDDQHLPEDVAPDQLFESPLLCVYSPDFQNHLYSLMPFNRLGIDDEFVFYHATWLTGSLAVNKEENQLIYSPGAYSGTLYSFQKLENGRWGYDGSFEGVSPFGEIYQRYTTEQDFNEAKENTIPGAVKIHSRGQFMGRLLSMDAGIFYLNDGRLVQFIAEWKEGEKVGSGSQHLLDISVQIFDQDLKLQKYSYLFSIQRNSAVGRPLIDWKDQQDRFYFLNPGNDDLFTTVPTVRRFTLDLPE